MRNKLIIGIVLLLLIGGFVLVSSEEPEEELFDFSSLLNIGGNVTGFELDHSFEETSRRKDTTFTLTNEASSLNFGNTTIKDVVPASDNVNATVILNKNGELIEADYTLAKKGDVTIGKKTISDVPANSRITFNEKDGLVIEVPDGAEFKGGYDCELKGNNIKLSDGNIFNSGKLNYGSTGQSFIKSGGNVMVNNVEILAGKDLSIYFDGEKHPGNYVSFGDEFYFGGGGKSGEIVFEGKNKYFKNMNENDLVKFGLGEKESEIRIVQNKFKDFPRVYCENQYVVNTGKFSLTSNGLKIYYAEVGGSENSVEMDIYDFGGKYKKLISIGGDSNIYAQSYEGDFLSSSSYKLGRETLEKDPDVILNSISSQLWDTFEDLNLGLKSANKILKGTFERKYPNLDLTSFENAKNNLELDNLAENVPDYYVLTAKDVKDALEGTPYKNYFDIRQAYSRLPAIIVPTSGVKEDLGEGAVGIRSIYSKLGNWD